MSTFERAIAIAAEAHAGQMKAGEPYILHPLRVMMDLDTETERITGILHDVVEKSEIWTLDALRSEGFSETIVKALDAVTRREDEDEEAFARRAASNGIGRRVKLADIADNKKLAGGDPKRMERLERAERVLVGEPMGKAESAK